MKNLFLYETPFLVEDTTKNRLDYLSETVRLTEEERTDEQKLHLILLKFCADNKIIHVTSEELLPGLQKESGDWAWIVNWMNMRSLVDKAQYVRLLNSLKANEQYAANEILSLHTRIGAFFDHRLLNTVCHRVMSSVSLIPYSVPKNNEEISWEALHKESPYLWLIILLQAVLKNETKKLV